MALDPQLVDRIRGLLADRPGAADISERRMFGGVAFLVAGHMAVAASHEGGILVRTDPADTAGCERLLAEPGVSEMLMRGRPMAGWLRVDADRVRSERDLHGWVEIGVTYAASLPPKR